MISRCQSDIILSNRFIETHYKRVDKGLEKCKALLRGIQKEFKKTRHFWEQLKADENSTHQKFRLPSCDSDSKKSEDSTKNRDVDTKNELKVVKKTTGCSRNVDIGSKNVDEQSINSLKNVDDFQEDNITFSRISKLDVKHLEAFLDIVQKTQVSQSRNNNESSAIEDSSDLEVFEDALCQLSSVTSLTFESLTSSDVSMKASNLVEKTIRVDHNKKQSSPNSCLQLYNDVKVESLTEGISELADLKIDQIHTNIDDNSLEHTQKPPILDVDDLAEMFVPDISKSGGLKNETEVQSFDDSDSEVYHEACDFSYFEIKENKSNPFFFHSNFSKGEICEAKCKNIKPFDNTIVRADSEQPYWQKVSNTNGGKNERVVKFSGNNEITYKNDSRITGVGSSKYEFHRNQKRYSQADRQLENRSRPRVRFTKQRKTIRVKQKDRSKTRSRSRKKSYHDIAVGTSDLDLFEYFNQRLLKQRDPFYSIPTKRRHFDYSTEEPNGIFHPSFLQPYNFSNQYDEKHQRLLAKKNSSCNSLFKQPFISNELSDNGSNTTFSIKRSSSSDQGNFFLKTNDYPSEDRISIHNSTILNKSNTNIYVFRSFEDRFKPAQVSDLDDTFFNTSDTKKPVDRKVYSESESSRGRASSTDRKPRKKKYLTAKSRKQAALNEDKTNISREVKQKDCSSGNGNLKEGKFVSKVQAVIPYVGHIHSNHIKIPHCTQLFNETKILHSRQTLMNFMRNCSHESLRNNESFIRKQRRKLIDECDLVGKENIDMIFNNKSKLSLDSEKQKALSREGCMRRPSSSTLNCSSKQEDKDVGIKRSSDCRLQLVNCRGDIHLSEMLQKSPHNSSTSLNREYTVSKIDRTSNKTALEPRVLFKISASSDDLRNEKLNCNEQLANINLTKSSSSCSGIESETFSKRNMKNFNKKYVSCNDLVNDDHFYSKINIIPLMGDNKGIIQQVSIVGQRLWVQGATISAYKNSFTEQEDEKKVETGKMSTGTEESRPASSSKKSDVDKDGVKSEKTTKNDENVVKEVIKKKPVLTPHMKVNRKNEITESKPRFCPYVNKNYSTNRSPTNKNNNSKSSNMNNITERKAQLSPNQPSVKSNINEKCKVFEKEKIVEEDYKSSDIVVNVPENFNSNNVMHDKVNSNDLSVTNMEVRCAQNLSLLIDKVMSRGINNDNSLKVNSETKIVKNDNFEELVVLDKTHSNDKLEESLVGNSSNSTKFKTTSRILNNKHDVIQIQNDSDAKIDQNSQIDSGDVNLSRIKSQQKSINLRDQKRLAEKNVRFKKRSSSKESSSEENLDQLEDVKRVRQNLCSILPNSPFRQSLLKKLNGADKNQTSVDNEQVDVFGAPLTNSSGRPFYNEYGYPVAQMSGVSLYNSRGIPTKGAYGRPLHTSLKKELAKIVEGSEERRNVFHRMNRIFEEQLLHILQTTSNWKIDEFGRVYDTYGRALFDRYGYILYDLIGNPLTDAFGRKLTDKYGVSIMGPRRKCANVLLTTLSSNESLYSHQSSDERLVKNRTELINRRKDTSKENMWKKHKRQVSFNMDPTIITLSHSDSEVETSATNFKR